MDEKNLMPVEPAGQIGQTAIFAEMDQLMDAAKKCQLELRLIGGLAVKYHSPTAANSALRRNYPDIDVVADKKSRHLLPGFFASVGYMPDKNFNLFNGDRRQIYIHAITGRRVDVFVGDFEMCHKLPMSNRLEHHPVTVPLAELFLSKIQIVELNRKDALDIISLLIDNGIGYNDNCQINIDRITRLCLRDWGLYKTLVLNLAKIEQILLEEQIGIDEEQSQRVMDRINTMRSLINKVNKPFLWKVRDSVGTRIRWYAEVEEVER